MMRHNDCTGAGCGRCRLYDSGERPDAWWLAIGGKVKRRADPGKPRVAKGVPP
jgi:hypothetical protein